MRQEAEDGWRSSDRRYLLFLVLPLLIFWLLDEGNLKKVSVRELVALVEAAQYEPENDPCDPKCARRARLKAAAEFKRLTGQALLLFAEDVEAEEREVQAREEERISREEWMRSLEETPEGRNMMRLCKEVFLKESSKAESDL